MDAIETQAPEYEDDTDPRINKSWDIEDLNSADWALEQVGKSEAEKEAVESMFTAAVTRLRARADEIIAKADRRSAFFKFKLLVYAERHQSELLVGKKRSREFLHGRIAWRAKPERLEVTDKPALVEWLASQPIESGLYRVKVEPELRAIQEQFKATGEIPPGCDLAPESETIHVEATSQALSKE